MHSVTPGSDAAKAGILPQDAVQFAIVAEPKTNNPSVKKRVSNPQSPSGEDRSTLDNDQLCQQVLDAEDKGLRLTYDDLRALVASVDDPSQSAFLSPPTAALGSSFWGSPHNNKTTTPSSAQGGEAQVPDIPANVCVPSSRHRQHHNHNSVQHFTPTVESIQEQAQSQETAPRLILCFRRTRQRKVGVPSHVSSWSFRLDDECDFATQLVQRLAPTQDMDLPNPDTWQELVHDGTDWLLGNGSILPPRTGVPEGGGGGGATNANVNTTTNQDGGVVVTLEEEQADEEGLSIPLDPMERERARKLAQLRSRMAAEAMLKQQHSRMGTSSNGGSGDRTEDVEAVTIRGMIQKAVGLAFVRSSKVVLGVSVHAGSGIVVARLSDGTWSAPSAIGTWGIGLGLQFGLEVAEYIFILQTNEALEHFRRGGSFTVGGNVGAAVAGVGREAYGAASVGGTVCGNTNTVMMKDDEYNHAHDEGDDNGLLQPAALAIAPIVAYAKSQGLYIGVSLEGSRIFTRDDINRRAYKFVAGKDVTSHDILTGKVATPPEAEELYAALHSVEFTHEMSCLPRPPEILRNNSSHPWSFQTCTLSHNHTPFCFLSSGSKTMSLSQEELEELETFETQFKAFMYGGVSVQRVIPEGHGSSSSSRLSRTAKERRTLWLMLPEVGSLRLGFVSKLSDGEGVISNKSSTQRAQRNDMTASHLGGSGVGRTDHDTVGSEEVTLDSALRTQGGDGTHTVSSLPHNVRTNNVQLSRKHSVGLTDVTLLTQDPPKQMVGNLRFKQESQTSYDKMEHLRIISIQDVSGTQLLFLANNFREAELLVCGLKLLLERETTRLNMRGGIPRTSFFSNNNNTNSTPQQPQHQQRGSLTTSTNGTMRSRRQSQRQNSSSNYYNQSGTGNNTSDTESVSLAAEDANESNRTWGNVPGRHFMRQAASSREQGIPHYTHGLSLDRRVTEQVRLPLPLPLCRVLLLDSTSPVITTWENDRGDAQFEKTDWTFPRSAPRELERHASEHQLIASGSMCDAHRTVSFQRPRYGALVRLTEVHTVEADDSNELVLVISERNPRRGFSIKVRILLRPSSQPAHDSKSCEATVIASIRPIGKDMSNQAAVHKAFQLVVEEIKDRYGVQGKGLLAGFLSVVDGMADASANGKAATRPQHDNSSVGRRSIGSALSPGRSTGSSQQYVPPTAASTRVSAEGKVTLPPPSISPARPKPSPKTSHTSPTPKAGNDRKGTGGGSAAGGLVSFDHMLGNSGRDSPETTDHVRPSTPSLISQVPEADPAKRLVAKTVVPRSDEFDLPPKKSSQSSPQEEAKEPVLIEVKPLPKVSSSVAFICCVDKEMGEGQISTTRLAFYFRFVLVSCHLHERRTKKWTVGTSLPVDHAINPRNRKRRTRAVNVPKSLLGEVVAAKRLPTFDVSDVNSTCLSREEKIRRVATTFLTFVNCWKATV